MSQTENLEKTLTSSLSNTNYIPNKKIPILVSVSSSTFLLSFVSLSLLAFSVSFLSFKDTNFWFFLSNAIILFLAAANSNTFSPSKPIPGLYDDYVKNIRFRNTYSYMYSTTELSVSASHHNHHNRKDKPMALETEAFGNRRELTFDHVTKKPTEGKYSRSESEKAMVVVGDEKKVIRRSQTENGGRRLLEGDYSALSDEELNRRVEEFIKRIKGEIRLEEMGERMKNI